MEDNKEQFDSNEMLFKVAEELCGLVVREHQILQGELSQVGVLVEDAVQSLGANLRVLNECLKSQEIILNDHEKEHSGDRSKDFLSLSDQVNKNTSEMIRALQFDDIVQQLSRHASERIEQMHALFNVLGHNVSELKSFEFDNIDDAQSKLKEMVDNIAKYRLLLEKNNPVKQSSMNEGSIELF